MRDIPWAAGYLVISISLALFRKNERNPAPLIIHSQICLTKRNHWSINFNQIWSLFNFVVLGPMYIGCFNDDMPRLFLNGYIEYFDENSPEYCSAQCESSGFFYAGVQYSVECFCGQEGEDYARYGQAPDTDCSLTCPGDGTERCGGAWRMAVYQGRWTNNHLSKLYHSIWVRSFLWLTCWVSIIQFRVELTSFGMYSN